MAKSEIKYIENAGLGSVQLYRRPVERRGPMQLAPGQGADGYGRKITTDYVLQLGGEGRKYRVYCCCFSNAGSNYVIIGGQTYYLQTYFSSEIPDEPKG